jgi:uncharacterized protein (DUF1330 family)
MAVYLINSYDITNPDEYKTYGPKVLPILRRYGAEVLASDVSGVAIEGKPKTMNAIIKFPSEEAVHQCYEDPEYAEVKKIRHNSTRNCTMVVVKEFVYPQG